jgi:hypothetical protein
MTLMTHFDIPAGSFAVVNNRFIADKTSAGGGEILARLHVSTCQIEKRAHDSHSPPWHADGRLSFRKEPEPDRRAAPHGAFQALSNRILGKRLLA